MAGERENPSTQDQISGLFGNLWPSLLGNSLFSSSPAAASVEAPIATSVSTGAPVTAAQLGAAPTSILGNAGSMGLGPLTGIAATAYLGGREGLNMLRGNPTSYSDFSTNPAGVFGRGSLAVATGGLSEIGNAIGGQFGRNPRVASRNQVRSGLRQTGLGEDLDFQGFRVGPHQLEGGAPVESTALGGQAIAFADPLAEMLAEGNEEKRQDIAAILARAIVEGAETEDDLRRRSIQLIRQMGGGSIRRQDIEDYARQNVQDEERRNIYLANLGRLA